MTTSSRSLSVPLLIASCLSIGSVACKSKRSATPPAPTTIEEAGGLEETFGEDITLLEKAVRDTLPEGWKLGEAFKLEEGHIYGGRVKISPDVMLYKVIYSAEPTSLMVEEGSHETGYAEQYIRGKFLFPYGNNADLPPRLQYPGKTPPPSMEEFLAGKTLVTPHPGHMSFRIRAEIRRSAGTAECVIIEQPKAVGLRSGNTRVYPLHQAKPETYVHGVIEDSMGIDPTRRLEHLVKQAVAKREAELKADGMDKNQERNRVGAIYRLRAENKTD